MLGLHFFIPFPLMKLVESCATITTSDDNRRDDFQFAQKLGRSRFGPRTTRASVVNLLLVPTCSMRSTHSNRTLRVSGHLKAMQLGAGNPMGPFTLSRFVGLDTTYKIAEIMFDEYREKRYAPRPPLLKRMGDRRQYGRNRAKVFTIHAGPAARKCFRHITIQRPPRAAGSKITTVTPVTFLPVGFAECIAPMRWRARSYLKPLVLRDRSRSSCVPEDADDVVKLVEWASGAIALARSTRIGN